MITVYISTCTLRARTTNIPKHFDAWDRAWQYSKRASHLCQLFNVLGYTVRLSDNRSVK